MVLSQYDFVVVCLFRAFCIRGTTVAEDAKFVVANEFGCGEIIWSANPTDNFILTDCSLRSISFTLFKPLLL